jgi:hypothetical protein
MLTICLKFQLTKMSDRLTVANPKRLSFPQNYKILSVHPNTILHVTIPIPLIVLNNHRLVGEEGGRLSTAQIMMLQYFESSSNNSLLSFQPSDSFIATSK